MDRTDGLLTLEEAARYLGVSKSSLRRWTNEGRLACHRIGSRGARRFDIQQLNDFLARSNAVAAGTRSDQIQVVDQLDEYARLGVKRHVCLFHQDENEQWNLFRPYLLDHLQARQPVVFIRDSSSEADFIARLQREGIDGGEVLESGLLKFYESRDIYLKDGIFSADRAIETMRDLAQQLIDKGSQRQLLAGEMTWFFSGSPGTEEIHDYETRLNVLLENLPSVTIVCHYDTSRFSAQDALTACCSHPVVYMGSSLLPGYYSQVHHSD